MWRLNAWGGGAPGLHETASLALGGTFGLLKILFRNRVLRGLMLPIDRQDPPALAVMEYLEAVDAAHEWGSIVWIMPRFVGAPNMTNPAKHFCSPRYLRLVKALLQKWPYPCDVTLDIQNLRLNSDVVSSRNARGWN